MRLRPDRALPAIRGSFPRRQGTLRISGVARANVRWLFTAGVGAGWSAQDVFTNRVSELEAFERSLSQISSSLGDQLVTDLSRPRCNVLVYYGVGGVGKTRLSEVLDERFTHWKLPGLAPRRASIRLDFSEAGSFDMESLLLRIRAGLARLEDRWAAFDLAFTVYWQRAHPGRPLQEFVREHRALGRLIDPTFLIDQVTTTVSDLLTTLATPAILPVSLIVSGGRVAHLLYGYVKQAIDHHALLRDCPFFAPLIDAEADADCLSYLPALIAWQLERMQPPPLVVIFLDTFENVVNRPSRDFERLIQRVIYLMPNVLFVVTGRRRLDWGDSNSIGELDYVGPHRWPNLRFENHDQEPRQHLVGYLSPQDCERYLANALTANGHPVIPSEIRERIVAGSGGLPLYLDLSVGHYLTLLAQGREPSVEDFGGPFPAIVGRVMRELSEDERRLLRGLSLLEGFDVEVARGVGAPISDATLARFLAAPFIEHDPGRGWPYALHANLRQAIRSADADLRDAWSPREWDEARRRILGQLAASAEAARRSGDRDRMVACYLQGLSLAGAVDELQDWLVEMAAHLAELGLWDVLDPEGPPSQPESSLQAFRLLLHGMRLIRQGVLGEAEEVLSRALSSAHLSETAARLCSLNLGDALRIMGRYDDGAAVYAGLAHGDGREATRAAYWMADIDYLKGRFQAALRSLELGDDDTFLRCESLRLAGHIYRVNAMFDEAELRYREALEVAQAARAPALEGEALTNLAEVRCWAQPESAREWGERALTANQAVGNKVEQVKARVALAVAAPTREESEEEFLAARSLAETIGYGGGIVFALVARAFRCLLAGDEALAIASQREIDERTARLGGNRFWLEIIDAWRGVDGEARADWLGGHRAARRRWAEVLARRRHR